MKPRAESIGKRFSRRTRYVDGNGEERLTRDRFAMFDLEARRREALTTLKANGIAVSNTTEQAVLTQRVLDHPDYALDSEIDLAAGILMACLRLEKLRAEGFASTWLPLNEVYRIGYLVARREVYRADAVERRKGSVATAASARRESDERKRAWINLRREIRRERVFEILSPQKINAEADKRLARRLKISVATIHNQRSRERWSSG